jgi:hypothetical protein
MSKLTKIKMIEKLFNKDNCLCKNEKKKLNSTKDLK